MNIPTTPPSGFRDFLPEACALRSRAVETISRVYRSYGFQPIATSAVEDLAVLMGKGGGENEKLIFKLLKRGAQLEEGKATGELADMGLRFDLTLPLARYYSKYGSTLPRPFKAFNIGPVWRAERAQKGRYREFYQCDADIIGSDSPLCEVEVISAILTAFGAMSIEGLTVLLNDRTILYALLDEAKVPADKRGQACVLLDKLDKVEREKVLADLTELLGADSTKALEAMILTENEGHEAERRFAPDAFAKLELIRDTLRNLPGAHAEFKISPALIRGFDYYTGPVFEFRHPKLSGSLGGGGRYDKLTEKFGGQAVPACGASIGFERLLLVLEETGAVSAKEGKRVCVTIFDENLRQKTLDLAAELRSRKIPGVSVDVFPGSGKLKAQFKYADSTGADYAVVMGPEEADAGMLKRKDMKTGVEALMSFEDLAAGLSPA